MTLAMHSSDGFDPRRELAQYSVAQLTALTKALLAGNIDPNIYAPEVLFACGKTCVTSPEISDGLAARMRIYDMIMTHPAASDLHRTRVAIAEIDMIRRMDTPVAATQALKRLDDIPQPPEHFPTVRAEWFQVATMCHDVRFNKGGGAPEDLATALSHNQETLRMAETPGFPADMAAFYIETRVGILQRAGRLDDTEVLQDLVRKLGVAVKNLEEGPSRDRAMALERFYYGALHELKGDIREAPAGYCRAYEIGPQPRYKINGAASLYRLCCEDAEIQALFGDKIEELREFVAANLHLLDKGDREKVEHLFTA